MTITIENPTAETLYKALQTIPAQELTRLGALLTRNNSVVDESTEWSEEDLRDFSNAGFALYEEIEAEELRNAQPR